MSARRTVKILGVQVDVLHKAGLLAQAVNWCQSEARRTITYANAHCLNLAQEDAGYRDVLNRADLVYSDGIGVVWAARWLAGAQLEKITGRDWIADLCVRAAADGLGLYLLGGQPGVAAQAAQALRQAWPGLSIRAARDGFFVEMSEADVLAEIAALRPHIVLVGMGAPRQDLWLGRCRPQVAAPVCWSVGALFDMLAGVERSVPGWMNALAMEWLWRMLMDPLGKWRRYLLGNPAFLLRVARQKFTA